MINCISSATIQGIGFLFYKENDIEMKYLQLINLIVGWNNINTGLVLGQEPYSIFIIDANGKDCGVEWEIKLTSGFYYINIYSSEILNNVQLKILY